MAEHNKLLAETEAEVREIRAKQRLVQEKMIEAEKESLEKWRADKLKNKPDESTIESLLQDPDIVAVEAPVDANVRLSLLGGSDCLLTDILGLEGGSEGR